MSRIIVEPLTRVEGHGRIELLLEGRHLQDVKVDLNEAPRLFEAMLLGRDWREVPEIVCRICGICSTVHKLAALTALEQALGVRVPVPAAIIRELALLGGHIQSHALHLFCLVLPDFYEAPSILDLLQKGDPLAQAGLELKSFGNRLQEVFGGRVVHPVNLVPGGVAHCPDAVLLETMLTEVGVWQARWPALAEDFSGACHYPAGGEPAGCCLATGCIEAMTLTGNRLQLASGMSFPVEEYPKWLGESPTTHSHAKQAAGQQGPFLVGALARAALAAVATGRDPHDFQQSGIYRNNEAQSWEIGWALTRARALLEMLLERKDHGPWRVSPLPAGAGTGIGVAAFEAPRGLLLHRYELDNLGRVAAADVVTPTAINQLAMAEQIRRDLAGIDDAGEMTGVAERVVRAFDPCISCAVHVLQASS